MKISYVILHYIAINETIECVNSIKNISKDEQNEYLIVIVDNCSPNDSFELLKKEFRDIDDIVIFRNQKNEGYARGNNVGYRYAKNKWKADIIVQINNDTVIKQKDFNKILVEKCKNDKYYVIGPDIITMDGFHQNPVPKKLFGLKELKVYRIKKIVKIILIILGIDNLLKKKDVYSRKQIKGDVENEFLHGACYIFTPKYLNSFDGMHSDTFLFWEEDILMLMLKRKKMPVLYTSDLHIYHMEDVATDMSFKSDKKKKIWIEKQLIKSSKIYEKVYRKGENSIGK